MSLKVKVGDQLPSVGLRATDGYLLNLRSFVTKQPALLVFFGGPTMPAGAARRRGLKAMDALAAGHERLREAGIAVAAISTDSEQQQTAFVAKHELPFLLLSDERRSAVNVLGVETVAEGANVNVAKPMALAVDADGSIRAILDPIDPDSLVDRAVRALSEPIPAAASDAQPAG
jgi:thioredoxin-dependent peroxiredoxin